MGEHTGLKKVEGLAKRLKLPGDNYFSGGISPDFDFLPENIIAWYGSNPGLENNTHIHHRMGIKLILSGSCQTNIDGIPIILNAGDALCVFPFQIHSNFYDGYAGDFRYLSITFVEKRRDYSSFWALKNRRLHPDNEDMSKIAEIMEGFLQKDAPSSAVVLPLLELLLSLRRKARNIIQPPESQDFFSRICKYIREHFTEDLSVKSLANKFGVTTETIRRQFHKYGSGLTPKKMIALLRHQLAIELIETTDIGIAQIAMRCGYSDPFAFSRAFKGMDGLSPLNHREKFKR